MVLERALYLKHKLGRMFLLDVFVLFYHSGLKDIEIVSRIVLEDGKKSAYFMELFEKWKAAATHAGMKVRVKQVEERVKKYV